MYTEEINKLALSIVEDIPFKLSDEEFDKIYMVIFEKLELAIGEGYRHQMG